MKASAQEVIFIFFFPLPISFAALLPPNYPAENISVELRKYHDKETIPYREEYVGVGEASDFLRVEPGK